MGLGACALERDVSSYLKCPWGVRGHLTSDPYAEGCGICLGAEGCFSQTWDTGLTNSPISQPYLQHSSLAITSGLLALRAGGREREDPMAQR